MSDQRKKKKFLSHLFEKSKDLYEVSSVLEESTSDSTSGN